MEIRKAKISDMGEIERIYSAAREYMRENGNPTQWGDSYPPKEKITDDIENGNLYLVVEDEIPHGVFAYIEWDDPTYREIYFGEWKNALPYAVMHRMASDGKIHGILAAKREHGAACNGAVRRNERNCGQIKPVLK